MLHSVVCDYCNKAADLKRGADLYSHREDLATKWFYVCVPCDATVGCHNGTTKPLGSLASKPLRQARMRTHREFDSMWRGRTKFTTRDKAYRILAEHLEITGDECHIGKFDLTNCQKTILFVRQLRLVKQNERREKRKKRALR